MPSYEAKIDTGVEKLNKWVTLLPRKEGDDQIIVLRGNWREIKEGVEIEIGRRLFIVKSWEHRGIMCVVRCKEA